jgi:hypothetical protein
MHNSYGAPQGESKQGTELGTRMESRFPIPFRPPAPTATYGDLRRTDGNDDLWLGEGGHAQDPETVEFFREKTEENARQLARLAEVAPAHLAAADGIGAVSGRRSWRTRFPPPRPPTPWPTVRRRGRGRATCRRSYTTASPSTTAPSGPRSPPGRAP